MNAPFVVAQAITTGQGTQAPPQIVKLTKPANGQAISLTLDANTRLDFSDIAGEQITLVRVGNQLVILFDNQTTITAGPFFDGSGNPLPDVHVDLGNNRIVDGQEFAGLFPISTDTNILPASGNSGGGDGFGAGDPTVDALNTGNPLDLLGNEDGNGITFSITEALGRNNNETTPVEPAPTAFSQTIGIDEDGGAPSQLFESIAGGPGDSDDPVKYFGGPGAPTPTTPLFSFGPDGPAAVNPIVFDTAALDLLGLTSFGQLVTWEQTGDVLTGRAGGESIVIELRVLDLQTGDFSVEIFRPLDHPAPVDGVADENEIDIPFNFTLTDGNGTTATGTLTVSVDDDTPDPCNPVPGFVEEGVSPVQATVNLDLEWGADYNNTKFGPIDRSIAFANNTTPGANVAVTDINGDPLPVLTSNGETVLYTIIGPAVQGDPVYLVAYTDPKSIPTSQNDPGVVFWVSLSDQNLGDAVFELRGPLDHPAPLLGSGGYEQALDLTFSFNAFDSDGDGVTGTFTIRVDAAGDVYVCGCGYVTIDYSALPGGVFINLDDKAHTEFGQTVAGDTATDLDGVLPKVIGIDKMDGVAHAIGTNSGDVIIGGDEGNALEGLGGNDMIRGGGGMDEIYGDDFFGLTSGNDTIYGGGGSDMIVAGAGADWVSGGSGDDLIAGEGGADTIYGDGGDDNIQAGAGDDWVQGGLGDDLINGAGGDDTLLGGRGDDIIYGGAGDDTIRGGRGADYIEGNGGDDNIRGGRGDDIIYGGAGDDTIRGGRGDDYIEGNGGDDRIVYNVGQGHDLVLGGGGDDIQEVYGTADTETYTINAINIAGDLYVGVNIRNGFGNVAPATPGNAEVATRGVEDIYIDTGTGPDLVVVLGSLGGTGLATSTITIEGGAGNGIDIVDASLLDSNHGITFYGRGGNDYYFVGAAGGTTTFHGGTGTDTIDFSFICGCSGGVEVDLALTVLQNTGYADLLVTNVENVIGSGSDDRIFGSDEDNMLAGGSGADLIRGRGGDDVIYGDAGDDTIIYNVGDGVDFVDGGEGGETNGDTLQINLGATDDYVRISPDLDADANLDIDIDTNSLVENPADGIELDVTDVEEIVVNTGAGNDNVVISGDLGSTGVATSTVTVDLGEGDDTLVIEGTSGDPVNVAVTGGEGNDTVDASARQFRPDSGQDFLVSTTPAASPGGPFFYAGQQIATLANGGFVVTWLSADANDGDIHGRVFDAAGNAVSGSEFVVSSTNANAQENAEVTALANGGFAVTWVSDDNGSDSDIRGRVFDATGNALPGGDFLVSTTNAGDQAYFPQIAALSNGGFVVTWPSIDGGFPNVDVRGRVFDASGAPVTVGGSTNDFLVPTSNTSVQFNPQITALAGGGFAVTWESNANSGQTDIHGRVFDAAGNPVNASDFEVSTANTNYQANPHITALANGGFAVTWSSDNAGTRDIHGRVFDVTGNAVNASDFLISTTTANDQAGQQITALANGGFAVTWRSNDNGSNYDIHGRVFNSGGNPLPGGEFVVSTSNAGDQQESQVTALATGGFVVTWRSADSDLGDIRGRVFDAAGNPVGDDFLVSTSNAGTQSFPQVAALPDGGFVVTWQSNDGSNDFDVRARVFDQYGVESAVTFDGGAGDDVFRSGAGNDIFTGGDDNDTAYYRVGDGRDTIDGGAGDDLQNITGSSVAETFNINLITLSGVDHVGINIEGGNGASSAVLASDTNYEVATKDVEDIFIDTGAGDDVVVVTGSLNGTGLAQSTITVDTGAGNDTLDLTGRDSAHRVVSDGKGGTDTVLYDFTRASATSVTEIFDNDGNIIGARITHDVNGQSVTDEFTNFENFTFDGVTYDLTTVFNLPPDAVDDTLAGLTQYVFSGTVNAWDEGTPWSSDYTFTILADPATRVATSFGYEIPLVASAMLSLPYFSSDAIDIATPMRIGYNTATNRIFFAATGPGHEDAYTITLTEAQEGIFLNQATFGPLTATAAQFNFIGLRDIIGSELPPRIVFQGGTVTGEAAGSVAGYAEDTAFTIATSVLTANDSDPEGPITFVSVQDAVGGIVSLSGGTITFVPAANYFGAASFTYTIQDSLGLTDTATVSFNIYNLNDAPVVAGDLAATVAEGGSVVITAADLGEADLDDAGAGLTYTVVTPANGQVLVNGNVATTFTAQDVIDGRVSFRHDGSETTSASFTFALADGGENGSTPATGTFNLTVTPVNDSPVIAGDLASTVARGASVVITTGVLGEADPDDSGAGLTYNVTSQTSGDVLVNGAVATTFTAQDVIDGRVSFRHDGSSGAGASFGFTLADGGEDGSTPVSGSVNLAVNEPPVAVDDHFTIVEDGALGIWPLDVSLLWNDSDPEGNPFQVISAQDAQDGTVWFDGDYIQFAPTANFFGTASFTYTIQDSFGGTDTATVYIHVTNVNDAPALDLDSTADGFDTTAVATVSGGPVKITSPNVSIGDIDSTDIHHASIWITNPQSGDQLGVDGLPAGFVATLAPDGSLDIRHSSGPRPFAEYEAALEAVTFSATTGNITTERTIAVLIADPAGGTTTCGSVVTVNPAPVDAVDDTLTAKTEDTPFTIAASLLTGNDFSPTTFVSVQDAVGGIVGLSGGNITFTPTANYFGAASFTYTIQDSLGATDTATVNFTLNNVNDAPYLDLDGNNSSGMPGSGYVTVATTGGAGVGIADGDTVLSDIDDTHLEGLTVSISNHKLGDFLTTNPALIPSGISFDAGQSTPANLVFTGHATLADYQTLIRNITFQTTSSDATLRSIAVTVTDGGDVATAASMININAAPTITSGAQTGDVTEDANATAGGANLVVNPTLTTVLTPAVTYPGWSPVGPYFRQDAPGGHNGSEAILLFSNGSISQTFNTVAGQLYQLDYWIRPYDTGNVLQVLWDGVVVQSATGGTSFSLHTVQFVGDGAPTQLKFTAPGSGAVVLDDVTLQSVSPPAQQSTNGTITFGDVNTNDTHSASVAASPAGYVGTFSLGAVNEAGHTVGWTFTADNSALQFLRGGQTVDQTYAVTISDGHGGSVTQNVIVHLHGVNDAPVLDAVATAIITDTAGDDTFVPVTGTLTRTDADTGDTASFGITNGAAGNYVIDGATYNVSKAGAYGTLYVNSTTGAYTYVPNDGAIEALTANTSENFTLTVTDGGNATSSQTFTVSLIGTNDAPATAAGSGSGAEDTIIAVTLSGSDIDGSLSGFVIKSLPANGTLYSDASGTIAISDEQFVAGTSPLTVYFKADANWNGTATFDYAARDNLGVEDASPATATVIVTRVNHAPVLDLDANDSTAGGGESLVYYTPNTPGVRITDTDVSITDVDNTNATGANITLLNAQAGDALNVSGVLPGGITANITNGGTSVTLSGSASRADYETAIEAITFSSSNTNTVQRSLAVTILDGDGGSAASTARINVNFAPSITFAENGDVAEDAGTPPAQQTDSGAIFFGDANTDDTHSASFVAQGGGAGYIGTFSLGSVDQDDNSVGWNFVADNSALQFLRANQTVTQTYAVTLTDNHGATDTENVTVTLHGVNDAVTITSNNGDPLSLSVTENQTAVTTIAISDADVGDTYTWSLSGTDAALFNVSNAGVITFKNAPDFEAPSDSGNNNVYDLIVNVSDGTVTDTQAVTVTVTNGNELPVITSAAQTGSVTEDANATLGGSQVFNSGFETYVSSPLTFQAWTGSASGLSLESVGHTGVAVQLIDDASISQTFNTIAGRLYQVDYWTQPNNPDDWLRVSVDGVMVQTAFGPAGYSLHTLQFVANGSSTALKFIGDIVSGPSGGVDLDDVTLRLVSPPAQQTTDGAITFSDSDPGDTHSASFAAQAGGYLGTFSLDAVNQAGDSVGWHFAVDNSALQFLRGGQTVTQTYAVTVSDDHGHSAVQNVSVQLNGVNDAPVIATNNGSPLAITVSEGTNFSNIFSASDVDLGGPPLTWSLAGADAGRFNLVGNILSFASTPNFEQPSDLGFNNVYDLIVRVSDGTATDSQAVTVTVTNVNEAPSGFDHTVNMVEDVSYTFSVSDFALTDIDGNQLGGIIANTLPDAGHGHLLYANAAVSAGSFISAADIASGMLTYAPNDDRFNATTSFTFSVVDDGASGGLHRNTDPTPNIMTVALANGNYADNAYLTPGSTIVGVENPNGNASFNDGGGGGTDVFRWIQGVGVGGGRFFDLDMQRSDDNLEIHYASNAGLGDLTILGQFSPGFGTMENIEFAPGMAFGSGNISGVYDLGQADNAGAGSTNRDFLIGSAANDTRNGSDGDDVIFGGGGNDTLSGGFDNDIVSGGLGNDNVFGNDGNDFLLGGAGNDILNGGTGTDELRGGTGQDQLTGGQGADIFGFAEKGAANKDTILDYSFGEGDKLDLSALLDANFGPVSNVSDFVQIKNSGNSATVQVDTDGTSGASTWTDVAVLSNSFVGNQVLVNFENQTHQLQVQA